LQTTSTSSIAASFAALSFFAPSAAGQCVYGMPAGATHYMEASANPVCEGVVAGGDTAFGVVGATPYPSPNYVTDPGALSVGAFLFANGDGTPNSLRVSYANQQFSNVFFRNSMVDSYTISGPPGSEGTPVDARVVFRATGTLFVGQTNGNMHVGSSSLRIEVGTWNPSTDPTLSEQFRVTSFSPSFEAFQGIPFANYGTSTPTLEIDMSVDQVLTRTVGTAFDVAFGFDAQGNGAGNLSLSPSPAEDEYLVGTVDWVLPAGYQITSVNGWTDPDGASSYCTAGTSASGCQATLSATGLPSASAASGFVVTASGVEGAKDGLFFFGQNGKQANPWGNGTSYQCVAPPVKRGGLLDGSGTVDACDGTLSQDLNARWCPSCPNPLQAPAPGVPLQVQLWYRDPASTSNQSTSLSDALEATAIP
jgi:hypothetical protein